MTALRVQGLSKAFAGAHGAAPIVRNLDLTLPSGEIYALLGPSGCGKTTTLRCVAGLETPDAGVITLGDRTLFDAARSVEMRAHERDIGMVFQSYAIWPHMDVHDNVAYPLHSARPRPPAVEIARRVTETLTLVGLDRFERRSAASLSGGQQQRVALARALVRRPRLLLLDEPLSNLDARLRREMRSELRQLVKRLSITALYVTHDQREAFAIADRVGVMADGRILQEGTPREIYGRPASAFVAAFLGNANLVGARVVGPGAQGELVVTLGPPDGRLAIPSDLSAHPGDTVTLMVRPEDVRVGVAPHEAIGSAVVREVVFEGSAAQCVLDWSGEPLRARTHRDFAAPPGAEVSIAIDARQCMLYASTPPSVPNPTNASRR